MGCSRSGTPVRDLPTLTALHKSVPTGIRRQVRLSLAVCVAITVAVFVFAHTGSRAAALCARDGSAVPDGLSPWPPGVRCSGGEPQHTSTRFDAIVILGIPGVVMVVFGAAAIGGSIAAHRSDAGTARRG